MYFLDYQLDDFFGKKKKLTKNYFALVQKYFREKATQVENNAFVYSRIERVYNSVVYSWVQNHALLNYVSP